MTAKEKAKELVEKFYIICQEYTEEIQCSIQAKQCALIAVDEKIEVSIRYHDYAYHIHLQEVKSEIEKL